MAREKTKFKNKVSEWLQKTFKEDLNEKVERFLSIPSIDPIPTVEKFVQLIHEVFQLYTNGLFYSTVALCGITAERLCYDIIEDSKITINETTLSSSQKETLHRLNQAVLIDTLFEWGLVKKETKKKLHKIRKIRNKYIHPSEFSKQESKKDALKILGLLCQVINNEYGPDPNTRYTIVYGRIKRQY